MKLLLKRLAGVMLGEYSLYQVWRHEAGMSSMPAAGSFAFRSIDAADLAESGHPLLTESSWYCGADSAGFGCYDADRLIAVAFYWWGARYERRRSWPIERDAAKLVHIVTIPAYRGRAAARTLIEASAAEMHGRGFRRLYARIWHSNKPSLAAFAAVEWRPTGWLIEINPLRRARPFSIAIGSKRHGLVPQ